MQDVLNTSCTQESSGTSLLQGLDTHHTNEVESAGCPGVGRFVQLPKVFTRGAKNHCARTEATVHFMQEKITENTSLSPCQATKATSTEMQLTRRE